MLKSFVLHHRLYIKLLNGLFSKQQEWDSSDNKKVEPKPINQQQSTYRPYSNHINRTDSIHISNENNMDATTCIVTAQGDENAPGSISGLDRLKNPITNKGQAFTIEERQALGIHGLLPPAVKNIEDQLTQVDALLKRLEKPLDKFLCIMNLYDLNRNLFFKYFRKNIMSVMPIIYTPTIGEACLNYSLIFDRPRNLYITIYDKGNVFNVLKNWPERIIKFIVVTDGERILGLGDLGANGTPIPIGKLALYTGIASVKPHQCLPITIDVGTNNKALLADPLYIGLKQERVRGKDYDDLIDEFMEAVVHRFGVNTLIQFEDFGNSNAFRLLNKYRNQYCCFNDDIQGTASVTLAGILTALRVLKKKLTELTVVFFGAGEANIGIGELLTMAMIEEGIPENEARKRLWFIDSKGLIVKDRPEGGITEHKKPFAHDAPPLKNLIDVIKTYKPDVLIGAASIPGIFTKEVLQTMAAQKEIPVIFALSNPTSKTECTAEEAYTHTDGRCLFASGSPFPPVTYNGKTYISGQANNSYIFPSIAMTASLTGVRHITDSLFLKTASILSKAVKDEDLEKGCLFPPIRELTQLSEHVVTKLVEFAYEEGMATVCPEPKDKRAYLQSQAYQTDYVPAILPSYPLHC
ncbi:NADP-dependent malic enzyme-like [Onthophagus taurus]|uniref:NADP-dependent malic enzyme-like n=1 Tax=Onthophagus taurus TaxID=166361 RepID=UPI0039BDCE2B